MKIALIGFLIVLFFIQTTEAFWPYGLYSPWLWIGKRSANLHHQDIIKRTECIFVKETSMINCHGHDDQHKECKVNYEWEEPEFHLYGIGISDTIDQKYKLIPRKIDNSAWSKDFKMVDGKEKYYSLYHKEDINDFGIRVIDNKCFQELVDLLKTSKRKEKIYIESDKPEQTAVIIGEVVMVDKIPEKNDKSKRYWPYYGGFGGYGGYGFGGYGGYGWGGYGLYGKRNTGKDEEKHHMTAIELEEEIHLVRRELEDSLELSDKYANDFSKEFKNLKRDVQMLVEDSHLESSLKNRRSMWKESMNNY